MEEYPGPPAPAQTKSALQRLAFYGFGSALPTWLARISSAWPSTTRRASSKLNTTFTAATDMNAMIRHSMYLRLRAESARGIVEFFYRANSCPRVAGLLHRTVRFQESIRPILNQLRDFTVEVLHSFGCARLHGVEQAVIFRARLFRCTPSAGIRFENFEKPQFGQCDLTLHKPLADDVTKGFRKTLAHRCWSAGKKRTDYAFHRLWQRPSYSSSTAPSGRFRPPPARSQWSRGRASRPPKLLLELCRMAETQRMRKIRRVGCATPADEWWSICGYAEIQ